MRSWSTRTIGVAQGVVVLQVQHLGGDRGSRWGCRRGPRRSRYRRRSAGVRAAASTSRRSSCPRAPRGRRAAPRGRARRSSRRRCGPHPSGRACRCAARRSARAGRRPRRGGGERRGSLRRTSSRSAMRRRLGEDVRRAASVGWAVKTGRTARLFTRPCDLRGGQVGGGDLVHRLGEPARRPRPAAEPFPVRGGPAR